ncbi:hypothetical protein SGRA_3552 [Saprospira grandis str. Lewin]|uniref:Uncharacterized protein n=1 Tax=Saprospira grandis (strain Lewin) TaxID=984262 RepID=H6L0B2_SAPGL|nr:hypothetical protein SGRA_3552 [Saprospira grandis str. Lewin]
MPLFCFFGVSKVFFLIWGCPALRAGRAVPQLAGLLGPAALRALVWPSATAIHPSAEGPMGLFAGQKCWTI